MIKLIRKVSNKINESTRRPVRRYKVLKEAYDVVEHRFICNMDIAVNYNDKGFKSSARSSISSYVNSLCDRIEYVLRSSLSKYNIGIGTVIYRISDQYEYRLEFTLSANMSYNDTSDFLKLLDTAISKSEVSMKDRVRGCTAELIEADYYEN